MIALYHGFAREGNPVADSLPVHGILSAKILGLVSIVGAAYLAQRSRPAIARNLHRLFRVALLVFAAVCVSNLAVLAGAVA